MYIDMYIYVYIYIHTYVYIYVHMYTLAYESTYRTYAQISTSRKSSCSFLQGLLGAKLLAAETVALLGKGGWSYVEVLKTGRLLVWAHIRCP